MMTEKESKPIRDHKFPSLWVSEHGPKGLRYRHKVTGTISANPVQTYGGILADDMGLGKSLSTLALICSSLDSLDGDHSGLKEGGARATLIVTPKSTLVSWKQQIHQHIKTEQLKYILYHGNERHKLSKYFKDLDVVLTTYETLRSDLKSSGPLTTGKWLRVVLDEAHHIRNRSSQVFRSSSKLHAHYKWCLTGTPIQNSIDDFGALLAFLGVPSLTTKSQFEKHISNPIKHQALDSLRIFRDLVSATCLRRTKATAGLARALPAKTERSEIITLDEEDHQLYRMFQAKTETLAAQRNTGISGTETSKRNILSLITILRRICDHGKHMIPPRAFDLLDPTTSSNEALSYIMESSCSRCGEDMDDLLSPPDDSSRRSKQDQQFCSSCRAAEKDDMNDDTTRLVDTVSSDHVPPSAKVKALLANLQKSPGKSVVYTSWTAMLNLVEKAFRNCSFRFQRLDGQMSIAARTKAIEEFTTDPQCLVILCNIGSAAEGINLTVACNIHILEPHWNPMVEAQAIDRIHRIGQTKKVTITRYLIKDSVEMYVKWVQDDKLRLIRHSMDDPENADNFERRKAQVLHKYLESGKK